MATANNTEPLKGLPLKEAIEEFFNRRTVEGFSYAHDLEGAEDVYKLSLTSEMGKSIEAVVRGPQGFLDKTTSETPLFLEGVTVDRICVCEEGPFTGMAIHYTNTSGKGKMFRLIVGRDFVRKVFCEVFLREDCTATV
jgi:hypothetical protein